YSVWDKEGVQYVHPFLYMYLLTLGGAAALGPRLVILYGRRAMAEEWRGAWRAILVSGLLTFLAYALVLTALTFTRVSYVAPMREVGIVFAVLLGALFLKERLDAGRLVGSSLILVGLALIAVSP
ncbi:MAG: EamA family transporter, partial [Chloroflexi bacterium]|nr:EamA family transporter [Chloroflexota bacterium]